MAEDERTDEEKYGTKETESSPQADGDSGSDEKTEEAGDSDDKTE